MDALNNSWSTRQQKRQASAVEIENERAAESRWLLTEREREGQDCPYQRHTHKNTTHTHTHIQQRKKKKRKLYKYFWEESTHTHTKKKKAHTHLYIYKGDSVGQVGRGRLGMDHLHDCLFCLSPFDSPSRCFLHYVSQCGAEDRESCRSTKKKWENNKLDKLLSPKKTKQKGNHKHF